MDPVLPDHIVDVAASAQRAFADLGAVGFARAAEADPDLRERASGALRTLGVLDLEPLADADQALAAYVVCQEAGRVALPYPLEAMLCRHDGVPVVLADPSDPLVDHGDLLGSMLAVDPEGRVNRAEVAGPALGSRLAPFAVPVTLGGAAETDVGDGLVGAAATLAWVLTSATILGYAERAVELAVDHVAGRHQFGQRLADFQAVQFQVADAVVAVNGLRELGLFTIWRVTQLGSGAHVDALAVRLHAADVARTTMRTAQQLHGASGVAEEYDVSVLCRRVQSLLRVPCSSERLVDALATAIRADGFASLFPQGRVR
jgi:hypothetical protein